MTGPDYSPPPAPLGLLTLDDWTALPNDEIGRSELAEGVLTVSPRPRRTHQRASRELAIQLDEQLPPGLEVLQEVDVVLVAEDPPTVRVPDVVIARTEADDLLTDDPLTARDVLLAIEIVSPGSRGVDHVMKRFEYARAGIEHYWILDPGGRLTVLRRGADGTYGEVEVATASFTTDVPVRVRLELPHC